MKKDKYLDMPFYIKEDEVDENGKFSGYGSTFGGDPDAHGDIVLQGAFKNSIKRGGRNRNGIVMLWGHRPDQVPGVWTSLKEDNRGLLVEGQLLMDTQLGKETYSRIKNKAVKGLSIGYDILKKEIDEESNIRYLKELDLWEVSLVSFPANTNAEVLEIKSMQVIESAETPRELEEALREAGMSKNMAQYLVKLCRPSLREAEKEEEDTSMKNLLRTLKGINFNMEVNREIQTAINLVTY